MVMGLATGLTSNVQNIELATVVRWCQEEHHPSHAHRRRLSKEAAHGQHLDLPLAVRHRQIPKKARHASLYENYRLWQHLTYGCYSWAELRVALRGNHLKGGCLGSSTIDRDVATNVQEMRNS